MRILAIETATDLCSAGVYHHGRVEVASALEARSHYRLLNAQVAQVLEATQLSFEDLDYIAVDVGPGSFTGIRVGLSAALGYSLSRGIRMLPFMSLQSLALCGMERYQTTQVAALLDARMQACYCASYRWQDADLLTIEQPAEVAYGDVDLSAVALAVGPGVAQVDQRGAEQVDAGLLPNLNTALPWLAEQARRGQCIEPGTAQAVYIRNKVAQTRAERGLGSRANREGDSRS